MAYCGLDVHGKLIYFHNLGALVHYSIAISVCYPLRRMLYYAAFWWMVHDKLYRNIAPITKLWNNLLNCYHLLGIFSELCQSFIVCWRQTSRRYSVVKFVHSFCFGLLVFPVEPVGKLLERCLQSQQRLWPNPPQFLDTIADSIRTQQVRLRALLCICL